MSIAIKVENLSKAYQLGEIGTGTLSRDLERWLARVRGKEDPFLKIGETNDRTSKGASDIVWSLKDINFEIEQGDAVGIIGRNGAGKSTLLKILSRVTSPTTGKISGKGRIASLLEVGTGFHPELTGRENIFLNGAILGMRKKEIQRKFDEIVDFAGVERYVDTPVKRYSSGMYVRLAFAVAAHLDSEILIVDEVLAVGDAEFQKKCLGKMGEVSKGEGRTVLFVSHNMGSILNLCTTTILLKNGLLKLRGETQNVIEVYNQSDSSMELKVHAQKDLYIENINFTTNTSQGAYSLLPLAIEITIRSKYEVQNAQIGYGINDANGTRVLTLFSKFSNKYYNLKRGKNRIICEVKENVLKPGTYGIQIFIGNDLGVLEYYDEGLTFLVLESEKNLVYNTPTSTQGNIVINQNWL